MHRMLFYFVKLLKWFPDKYGFTPRKCNSASTLSGSIERDISKIIISLATNNEYLELFEKTLTGGFSCVNTWLPFDTEILLPHVKNPDKDSWKYYSYKVRIITKAITQN